LASSIGKLIFSKINSTSLMFPILVTNSWLASNGMSVLISNLLVSISSLITTFIALAVPVFAYPL
jgi:hypothetical protein